MRLIADDGKWRWKVSSIIVLSSGGNGLICYVYVSSCNRESLKCNHSVDYCSQSKTLILS